MPTVTEQVVPAFAHCSDARCVGYKQVPVDGVRTVTEFTYVERHGPGSVPGVELSTEMIRFANEAEDGSCSSCGRPRSISEQTRPEYPNSSGQAQDALLRLGHTDAEVKDLKHARELDEVKREQEMADMRRQIDALTDALVKQDPPRRGPGRPPKQRDDDA